MEQPNRVAQSLWDLIQAYRTAYHQARDSWPTAEADAEWHSPCLDAALQTGEQGVWQPIKRTVSDRFSHVEEAMSIELPSCAKTYWNSFFSGSVTVDSEHGVLELLQPWNDEDYLRFQQNLVGHLLTQQRFKLPATVFIGVIYDGEHVVSVDQQGVVWLELPGRKERERLADSLEQFLDQVQPVILPE